MVAKRSVRADVERKEQLSSNYRGGTRDGQGRNPCGNCGFLDHEARDRSCPARGRECRICGKVGHFGRCCRSRSAVSLTVSMMSSTASKRVVVKLVVWISALLCQHHQSGYSRAVL